MQFMRVCSLLPQAGHYRGHKGLQHIVFVLQGLSYGSTKKGYCDPSSGHNMVQTERTVGI